MPFVIFVAPWYTENALRNIQAITSLPDVRLGVISQEPWERLPSHVGGTIAAHWRVDDCLSTGQLTDAARALSQRGGEIHRLFGSVEQIQVPLAEARAQLGVPGMSVEATLNFRDKARMKTLLRSAGIPCARHRLVTSDSDAWGFAGDVGYPLVVKPPAGAAAEATLRVDGADALREILQRAAPGPGRAVLLEEFLTGEEHSFETISIGGRAIWHSLTHYYPTPLEVLHTPWMQWRVVLPREIDEPRYDDIRRVAFTSLEVLGMDTGLTHLEWFRRPNGSLAISEVAARPPGAQISTLISRAHDIDFLSAWARVMVYEEFEPPERRYAAGIAYLRGQGQGRVKAIHGLEQAEHDVGHLVVDVKLPTIGQDPSGSYEGEGYIIVRHPQTQVVEDAVLRLVTLIKVELG
ncbi:MAG: ATP-grasp domain-containing protein [bacterium]